MQVATDMLPLLARKLSSDNQTVLIAGLDALATLVQQNATVQEAARRHGLLGTAILLLNDGRRRHEAECGAVCGAVGALVCAHRPSQEALHAAGGIATLVQLAAYSIFVSVRARALFALECAAMLHSAIRDEVVALGGMHAAVALVRTQACADAPSQRVACQALAAVRGWATGDWASQQTLLRVGGLAEVLTKLRAPAAVAIEACATLRAMCEGCAEARHALLAPEGWHGIAALLELLGTAPADACASREDVKEDVGVREGIRKGRVGEDGASPPSPSSAWMASAASALPWARAARQIGMATRTVRGWPHPSRRSMAASARKAAVERMRSNQVPEALRRAVCEVLGCLLAEAEVEAEGEAAGALAGKAAGAAGLAAGSLLSALLACASLGFGESRVPSPAVVEVASAALDALGAAAARSVLMGRVIIDRCGLDVLVPLAADARASRARMRTAALGCLAALAHGSADAAEAIHAELAELGEGGNEGEGAATLLDCLAALAEVDEGEGAPTGDGGAAAAALTQAAARLLGSLARRGLLDTALGPGHAALGFAGKALVPSLGLGGEAASAALTAMLELLASAARHPAPTSPHTARHFTAHRTPAAQAASVAEGIACALAAFEGEGARMLVRLIMITSRCSPQTLALTQSAATLIVQLCAAEREPRAGTLTASALVRAGVLGAITAALCNTALARTSAGDDPFDAAAATSLVQFVRFVTPFDTAAAELQLSAREGHHTHSHGVLAHSHAELQLSAREGAATQALLAALTCLMSTADATAREAAQTRAREAGVLRPLLAIVCGGPPALHSPRHGPLLHALAALAAFTGRSPPNRTAVRVAGAVPSLLALLREHTPPDTLRAAVECLTQLAACTPDCQIAIADAGGFVALVALGAASAESPSTHAAVERCLLELALDQPRIDAAIMHARRAAAAGEISLSRPDEWPHFHRLAVLGAVSTTGGPRRRI